MKLLNIHKHGKRSDSSVSEIINLDSLQAVGSGPVSAGLHPWHLHIETAETEWVKLEEACAKANVLAIGECGLDKVCSTAMELQETFFIRQIELAQRLRKPLIIHCVRAFDEVLVILRKMKVHTPVVFHGYNKGPELANKIISEGYYLSFGKHILDSSSVQDVFVQTPPDKVFLETDASDISIESVYLKAAFLKGISQEELADTIENNARRVFGEKNIINHE